MPAPHQSTLDQAVAEMEARHRELAPLAAEFEQLTRALEALRDLGTQQTGAVTKAPAKSRAAGTTKATAKARKPKAAAAKTGSPRPRRPGAKKGTSPAPKGARQEEMLQLLKDREQAKVTELASLMGISEANGYFVAKQLVQSGRATRSNGTLAAVTA